MIRSDSARSGSGRTDPAGPFFGLHWPLLVLLALNILPELAFQLADWGLILPAYLRSLAYVLGAFNPDLFDGPGRFFAGQSLSMFLSYGFLHNGLEHLIVNMFGLVWLGRVILSYRTSEAFLTLYIMSMIGAAEVFALIHTGGVVVGASGAVFGLFGVYVVDQGLFTPKGASSRQVLPEIGRLALATVLVVLSDVLSQIFLNSPVAWQAHAGGFLTGAVLALISPPRGVLHR